MLQLLSFSTTVTPVILVAENTRKNQHTCYDRRRHHRHVGAGHRHHQNVDSSWQRHNSIFITDN